MKLISEYFGQRIWFMQPSAWKRFHEMKVGEETIGTLQEKGCFKVRWDITIMDKSWEIYNPSCWRSKLEIREANYELPFADFQRDGLRARGTLNLPKGERLKILPHLFKNFCEVKNERDESIVIIKPKRAFKEKAEVMLEKKSELIDKNPWILALAYIIMMEQKQQARHAAS